jgi:hypothetical protein
LTIASGESCHTIITSNVTSIVSSVYDRGHPPPLAKSGRT